MMKPIDEVKVLKTSLQLAKLQNKLLRDRLGEETKSPWLGDVLEVRFAKTMRSLAGRMEWDAKQAAAFCVELLQYVNHPAASDVNVLLALYGPDQDGTGQAG